MRNAWSGRFRGDVVPFVCLDEARVPTAEVMRSSRIGSALTVSALQLPVCGIVGM
jgi:hypothetical protein